MKITFAILIIAISCISTPQALADTTRESWIAFMSNNFPKIFCDENMMTRQCYSVTRTKCEEIVKSSANSCLKNARHELPPILNSASGNKWGETMGKCVGISYDIILSKNRLYNSSCNQYWK